MTTAGSPFDSRHARLAELRHRIQELRQEIRPHPVGSPKRDALAEQLGELAGASCALADELYG